MRDFLAEWGPPVPPEAGDATPPDFSAQCEAMLAAGPPIISSVMGLYPPEFVARLKAKGIVWFANISTVSEARAADAAGADVIVAQGSDASRHRGCFDAAAAERQQVGLFALLPAVVNAVRVPVVATGRIADARGVAAALVLGAGAAQIGTGFLRCPEAKIHPAWAAALAQTAPEDTMVSRVFSGRVGRSIATDYVRAASAADAPSSAAYPVPEGPHSGYTLGRPEARRRAPYAGLGRAIRGAGAGGACSRSRAPDLGRGAIPPCLIDRLTSACARPPSLTAHCRSPKVKGRLVSEVTSAASEIAEMTTLETGPEQKLDLARAGEYLEPVLGSVARLSNGRSGLIKCAKSDRYLS